MPELPEVETIRRYLAPLVVGRTIEAVEVREPRLRWRVARGLPARLRGRRIDALTRRGKYLLFGTSAGALLVHLGMSGSLRYVQEAAEPGAHDHVDVRFENGGCLRLNDPRRFGSLHLSAAPERHRLLKRLGPEPLGDDFTAEYLRGACRDRAVAIKQHLMNGRIVAGVGNIYANEALFRSGIHPARAAGRIGGARFAPLVASMREVLQDAVGRGGTTFRDFVGGDGRPGYFQLSLQVYDRAGAPCLRCRTPIRKRVIGQRAAYYCPHCQR